MHCKYLSVVPYKSFEKFSKALYGTTGGTYSARVFRPVMSVWYLDPDRFTLCMCSTVSEANMSRQTTLGRFGFEKSISQRNSDIFS